MTDKSFQDKHGLCYCHDYVKPQVREFRFFEITIREDAQKHFEQFLGDWISSSATSKFKRFILKKIAHFLNVNPAPQKIDFSYKGEGMQLNARNNQVLFRVVEKDLLKDAFTCSQCRRKIPKEWL